MVEVVEDREGVRLGLGVRGRAVRLALQEHGRDRHGLPGPAPSGVATPPLLAVELVQRVQPPVLGIGRLDLEQVDGLVTGELRVDRDERVQRRSVTRRAWNGPCGDRTAFRSLRCPPPPRTLQSRRHPRDALVAAFAIPALQETVHRKIWRLVPGGCAFELGCAHSCDPSILAFRSRWARSAYVRTVDARMPSIGPPPLRGVPRRSIGTTAARWRALSGWSVGPPRPDRRSSRSK